MEEFNFISTKGGNLTAQYARLFGANPFIHRKKKGVYTTFNPKLKSTLSDFYIGYVAKDGKLYLVIQKNALNGSAKWKMPIKYSKAPTFWEYVDKFFGGKQSNRYNLVFDRELGNESYLFTIEIAEEVNERTVNEERKAALTEQLAKAREARNNNTQEVDNQEVIAEVENNDEPVLIG